MTADDAPDGMLALVTEVERLRTVNAKLQNGECLGTIPPTDVACQRDCYCSAACQTRDADGSRGDLGRTLVPEAVVDELDGLRAALREACDIAEAVLMPNPRVSRAWYERYSDFRESIIRVRELCDLANKFVARETTAAAPHACTRRYVDFQGADRECLPGGEGCGLAGCLGRHGPTGGW